MLIQNNSSQYQNPFNSISNQGYSNAMGQKPYILPGGCYPPSNMPQDPNGSIGTISKIVGQFAQLIQTTLSLLQNIISQVSQMAGGGTVNSTGPEYFASTQNPLNQLFANSASAPASNTSSSWTDIFKDLGKNIYGLFSGAGSAVKDGASSIYSGILSYGTSLLSSIF